MLPENHPQNPIFIRRMFGKIAHRYDVANHVLSLGLDYGWRKKIARKVAAVNPRVVLDLATGSGDLAATLKECCPAAEIIAADFCLPMLLQARLKKVENLVGADGTRLPFADGMFDAVTVAFGLRNMTSYERALSEFLRVLKPGGRLFILDFSLPASFLTGPYLFYLRLILPSIAGLITGDKQAYEYLGESIEAFPRGAVMLELISKQGGREPGAQPWACGVVSLYSAVKKTDDQ